MAEPLSLLEFVRELLGSGLLRDQFARDPQSALDEHGLGHLTTADVDDALVLVQDTQTADFQRDYAGDHDSLSWGAQATDDVANVDPYVTHDYLTEHSTIFTGDHDPLGSANVVGHHNEAVTGSDNTTSFGSGSAAQVHTGDVSVGDGGSFNTGGSTGIDNSATSLHDVGDTYNSVSHSGTIWSDVSVHDSNNDTSDDSSESDYSQSHSHNDDSDHSVSNDNIESNLHSVEHHI